VPVAQKILQEGEKNSKGGGEKNNKGTGGKKKNQRKNDDIKREDFFPRRQHREKSFEQGISVKGRGEKRHPGGDKGDSLSPSRKKRKSLFQEGKGWKKEFKKGGFKRKEGFVK